MVGALAVLGVGWAAHAVGAGTDARPAPTTGGLFIGERELATARDNVFGKRYPWAVAAWSATKSQADAALSSPDWSVPNLSICSRNDLGCWQSNSKEEVYGKGNYAGIRAVFLAEAYAISREAKYAAGARQIISDWARAFNPPLPASAMFHYVAYPAGAMDKFFLSYDLVKYSPAMTSADRRAIEGWFRQFIPIARDMLTVAYDNPWPWPCPDLQGSGAPYGNSAAWALSLGALAAASVGDAASWQYVVDSNRMRDGRPYTWRVFMDRSMFDDGRTVEECVRKSLAYGLFTLLPLTAVAQVARHKGQDLFNYVAPSGHSLKTVWLYYAPYLSRAKPDPYVEVNPKDTLDGSQSSYTAVAELAYAVYRLPRLKQVVEYAGNWGGRGNAFDGRVFGYATLLFGRP